MVRPIHQTINGKTNSPLTTLLSRINNKVQHLLYNKMTYDIAKHLCTFITRCDSRDVCTQLIVIRAYQVLTTKYNTFLDCLAIKN